MADRRSGRARTPARRLVEGGDPPPNRYNAIAEAIVANTVRGRRPAARSSSQPATRGRVSKKTTSRRRQTQPTELSPSGQDRRDEDKDATASPSPGPQPSVDREEEEVNLTTVDFNMKLLVHLGNKLMFDRNYPSIEFVYADQMNMMRGQLEVAVKGDGVGVKDPSFSVRASVFIGRSDKAKETMNVDSTVPDDDRGFLKLVKAYHNLKTRDHLVDADMRVTLRYDFLKIQLSESSSSDESDERLASTQLRSSKKKRKKAKAPTAS